jgi:NAD(P)-dependent dehydrogenase (short-subunit alcohol dehydrogenase family)/cytochrome P450
MDANPLVATPASSRRLGVLQRHLSAQPTTAGSSYVDPELEAARLPGKVCVVTGAGSGIGRATAELFCQHGARTLCVDLDLASAEETAALIAEARPAGADVVAVAFAADVSDEAASAAVVAECVRRWGQLDVYFANAGILGPFVPGLAGIAGAAVSSWERHMRVNALGPLLAIKHAAPIMAAAGTGGSIVCTASIAARMADLTPVEYAASKAAVIATVVQSADRLAESGAGVRVNAVLPGFVMTGITAAVQARLKEGNQRVSGVALDKFSPAMPDRIAHVVLFLASDDSSFVNGQTITADGGLSNSMGQRLIPAPPKKKNKNKKITPAPAAAAAAVQKPPVVEATPRFVSDPIGFLMEVGAAHRDVFAVRRPDSGFTFTVLRDPTLFEDALTFEAQYGDPSLVPNMQMLNRIFGVSEAAIARHGSSVSKELRKTILRGATPMAAAIAAELRAHARATMGESGVADLRQLAEAVFWPMTKVLFGAGASQAAAPHMLRAFEGIDDNFGAALKGKAPQAVKDGVDAASATFQRIMNPPSGGGASGASGCPAAGGGGGGGGGEGGGQGGAASTAAPKLAPLTQFYESLLRGDGGDKGRPYAYSAEDAARFTTAAWWGGMGNTLPATLWTFAHVLQRPDVLRRAVAEADALFQAGEEGGGGGVGGGGGGGGGAGVSAERLPWLTGCLKETLRLKTYSVAWRLMKEDVVVTAASGSRYALPKHSLVAIPFALRHYDESIFSQPTEFRPERFVAGSGREEGGAENTYTFAPFSAGIHKCSGSALALLEIPAVMATLLHEYDMELLDPLPGLNWKSAFGVVGPTDEPVRVRYTRRQR